jgi:type I restriction enzyme, S subunit
MAEVWSSSVDKHSVEGEVPVQLCNYTDAYHNDTVAPHVKLMRATATPEEVRRFRLRPGDTVLTKDSEDPSDIGISAFVTGTADDFVCGYHLAIARPRPNAHPRFLNWALRARPALSHFSVRASGISRYGLGVADLRATPIPTHHLAQQRRIADFLDDRVARIDQIIATRGQQLHLLPDLLEAALVKAIDDLCSGSMVLPLGRVATIVASSVDKHSKDGELPVRLLNYVDVYRGDLVGPTAESMHATATPKEVGRFRLKVGDTVLTKDSEDPAEMGICVTVNETAQDFVCAYHLAIVRPFGHVHPRYLTWARGGGGGGGGGGGRSPRPPPALNGDPTQAKGACPLRAVFQRHLPARDLPTRVAGDACCSAGRPATTKHRDRSRSACRDAPADICDPEGVHRPPEGVQAGPHHGSGDG